jgi:2-aminoadipate transaminase
MDVPRSFICEILNVRLNHSIISFAGGLSNRYLFLVEEIKSSTRKALDNQGRDVLQYSNSEGYVEQRKLIAQRYLDKKQLSIPMDQRKMTGQLKINYFRVD